MDLTINEFYKPRKLIFKAWNNEAKLLMRLDSISCHKGELFKKDHILLQYTGLKDKQSEELFEMDIVLIDSVKHVIQWSDEIPGWIYVTLSENKISKALTHQATRSMIRLCNFFESSGQ